MFIITLIISDQRRYIPLFFFYLFYILIYNTHA